MYKIISFADKRTEKIYNQEYIRGMDRSIQQICLRKLMMLDFSENINDLRIPPGNHLEKLLGDFNGYWSIRINQQYRIVFEEKNGYYYDVKIIDYH